MKLGTTGMTRMIFFAKSKPIGKQRRSGIGFIFRKSLSLIEFHDSINLRWEIGTIDTDEINVNCDADYREVFIVNYCIKNSDHIAQISAQ